MVFFGQWVQNDSLSVSDHTRQGSSVHEWVCVRVCVELEFFFSNPSQTSCPWMVFISHASYLIFYSVTKEAKWEVILEYYGNTLKVLLTCYVYVIEYEFHWHAWKGSSSAGVFLWDV